MNPLCTSIQPMKAEDRSGVMKIFNDYIENSFAAFPENRLDDSFFDRLMGSTMGLPAYTLWNETGEIVGYALLRPYNPMPVFRKTGEVSYFIRPDYTGKGLGKKLLETLENSARALGLKNLLAEISSKNPGSVRFHEKNGFEQCGQFKAVGTKHGEDFDIIWMQKCL